MHNYHYYSTITPFYHIRPRERAKYEPVSGLVILCVYNFIKKKEKKKKSTKFEMTTDSKVQF